MKKYWISIVISLVIVMTISFYYIQVAIASKSGEGLTIETTSGNNEEIENLILEGSYYINDFFRRELYISKEGTSNQINRSFIDSVFPSYIPLMFQQHVKDHRNFMRGKDLNELTKFHEDEARLIYTSILNDNVLKGDKLTLQIDILDKNTNDRSSFEVSTSAQASYAWMNIRDVYSDNGIIKILATSYLKYGGEELHLYTVDENKKELEHAKVIPGDNAAIRIYNDTVKLQNENYYLYMVEPYENQREGAEPNLTPSQMYVYNISKDIVDEWTLPAEFKPYLNMTIIHGSYIYIPVPSAQGLELNRYNIEKLQWEEPLFFKYTSSSSKEEIPFIKFIDNKLYLIDSISDGNVLIIGDLVTGELLYEGKITNKNSEKLDNDYPLYIEQMYIMN